MQDFGVEAKVSLFDETNEIDPSAQIDPNVKMGKYNRIGKNVVIAGFKDGKCRIEIGDCNVIQDDTRILCPTVRLGDWNVIHNHSFIGGEQVLVMEHNCWVGQNSILDSTGQLWIGNGVRVGMYSQVWSHAASAEEIEGCTLFAIRATVLEDECWLVGSCFVGSGVRIGRRSICLPMSVITKDTEPLKTYAGVPAKEKEGLGYWKDVTLDYKFDLMIGWAREFAEKANAVVQVGTDNIVIWKDSTRLLITCSNTANEDPDLTTFFLARKTYTKRLSQLERDFYKYLFGHKSRFIPE